MRIAVHDYAGHPFQFELSRSLARLGHEVRHFYFAGDAGPKGQTTRLPDDPETFSIAPVSIPMRYSKTRYVYRAVADLLYGRVAARAIRRFRPEVVISGNTPLDSQAAIQAAAHSVGAGFVFWVQDFYSVAIQHLVAQKGSAFRRLMATHYRNLETRMLRRSDSIVLISEDFRRYLPPGVDGTRPIHVVPNWGPIEAISPGAKRNPWAEANGFADRFTFLYTGTLALKHNPGLLWDLARSFKDDPDLRVGVVSAGVGTDLLRARLAEEPLDNLVLLPQQPMSVFPDVLASADVLIAVLEDDAGEFSVPSKVLSYLCAGRPILLAAPSENLSSRIVTEAGAGVQVRAGDVDAFREAALRFRRDHALREQAGAAGRAYAEKHFVVEDIARRFERILEQSRHPHRRSTLRSLFTRRSRPLGQAGAQEV
ncbi:glycosyltransferase family 4 protein [Muricoccus radiodurans]|uniref:glycosyltransferase family 4 protein n=1 Tax=Muricoccus radiodurans TaxID=2231721 RepID=UPI003CF62643